MTSIHRWSLAAAVALSGGGCAVIAGYDFGKYTETGGAGGMSSASSTAASGGGATASSAGSGGGTTSAASSTAASSAVSASAGSSGTGGAGGSGMTTLLANLASPDAIGLDTDHVFYTSSLPLGTSSAGWVAKDGTMHGMPVQNVEQALALAMDGPTAYVATTTYGGPGVSGLVYSFGAGSPSVPLGDVHQAVSGVAAYGGTVYFTVPTSGVWKVVPPAAPGLFIGGNVDGLIAADGAGIYWPDAGTMRHAAFNGTGLGSLGAAGGTVSGIATDDTYVYWIASSAVYRVDKLTGGTPAAINTSDGPPIGLAIDAANGLVFYTHDAAVSCVTLATMTTTVVANGLANPHGVAVDAAFIYVALNGTFTASDGSIVKIPR